MAKRCFRLKKSKEIAAVYQTGKRAFSGSLTLIYRTAQVTRYTVCVGKKYGKSVERNRIKRLLREAFASYGDKIAPVSALLVPKVREEYSVAQFKRDLGKILEREKLFLG